MAGPGLLLFVTLTAPGTGGCRSWCPCLANAVHSPGELAVWNGSGTQRVNHVITELRRTFGDLAYARVVEVQRRGALHYHLVVRFSGPVAFSKVQLRGIAMRYGFGHAVDVQVVRENDRQRIANYLAKYVSKSVDDQHGAPICDEDGVVRRCRLFTQSRDYGPTMKALRQRQRDWFTRDVDLGGAGGRRTAPQRSEDRPHGPGDAEGGALDPNSVSYAEGPVSRFFGRVEVIPV